MSLAGVWTGVLQQQASGGGGVAFSDFFGAYSFVHEYGAEDPGWTNPGDGNAVSAWDNNGSDGSTASQGTGGKQPIYRASSATSGKPSIQFDGTDDFLVNTAGTADAAPYTHFIAFEFTNSGVSDTVLDASSFVDGTIYRAVDNTLLAYNGNVATLTGTDASAGNVLFCVYRFDGSTPEYRVNGVTELSSGGGGGSATGLAIGGRGNDSDYAACHVHYCGRYAGDLMAQSGFADWESAVLDYYGIT